MRYECELENLYLKDISENLTKPIVEYPIKSRYLDLEYEKFTFNLTDIEEKIKKTWLIKNLNAKRSIEINDIDVRIKDFSFWTSIFQRLTLINYNFLIILFFFRLIIRFYYFLTINKVNIDNNHDYREPTLEDLNNQISNVN